MVGPTKGIAHVSFRGGGMFIPARNPYDRQMLVEHVAERVRAKGQVQVLIDDQRWMVHLNRAPSADFCSRCGYALRSACYSTSDTAACCVRCAFGGSYVDAAPAYCEMQRLAGP